MANLKLAEQLRGHYKLELYAHHADMRCLLCNQTERLVSEERLIIKDATDRFTSFRTQHDKTCPKVKHADSEAEG